MYSMLLNFVGCGIKIFLTCWLAHIIVLAMDQKCYLRPFRCSDVSVVCILYLFISLRFVSPLPPARASLSPDNQVSGCDAGREPFFQPLIHPPPKNLNHRPSLLHKRNGVSQHVQWTWVRSNICLSVCTLD